MLCTPSRAVAAFAVLGALATGCGGSKAANAPDTPAAGDRRLNLAFLPGVVANPYFQAQIDEMKQQAQAQNADLTVVDSALDANKQAQQMQDLVSTGKYDGILIVPLSGAALVPIATQAVRAKIALGVVNVPLGPDSTSTAPQVEGVAVYAGRPFSKQGDNLGKLTLAACANIDPCRVAFMYGVKASVYDQVLFTGFKSAVSASPAVQVVAEAEGGYTREGGLTATQNLVQRDPDLNVLVTVDQSGLGAETALQGAGLEGKVQIIGYGGSGKALEAVRSGRWFGDSVQVPRTEARAAIDGVIAALRGKQPAPYVDPVEQAGVPDDGRVTRENAAGFKAEYDG